MQDLVGYVPSVQYTDDTEGLISMFDCPWIFILENPCFNAGKKNAWYEVLAKKP